MRSWLTTIAPAAALTLAGFVLAYQFVDPAPPKRLTISTGSPDGAYQRFAERYRELLAHKGIELELRPSAGSLENLQRLRAGEVDAALVQGGTSGSEDEPGLVSLGALYYEPFWIFVRGPQPLQDLRELRGRRVAVGATGSGTRALAERLLEANALQGQLDLLPLGGQSAVDALVAGEVDAACFVASPQSGPVRALLERDDISLASLQRAEAYTRLLPFLSRVRLVRGMVDLAHDLPPRDHVLLAAAANLVVREDLHPALQDQLLQAAERVHREGGWFEDAAEFPKAAQLELPLSPEARRFYKHGAPLLQRYLPFWAATLIDRLKVMLLPLVVLLIPLFKIMPPIYTWRMRSRVYRWYRELELIDLAGTHADADLDDLHGRLDRVEHEIIKVSVPLSFANQLYDLRQHLDLVRRRLEPR